MPKCKSCGHEQYDHHGGYGRCYVVLVKRESEFYEVSIGPNIRAWTQDIEYGDECPCRVMRTWMPSYEEKENSLSSNNLDTFM